MSHDSRYEAECPKHGWYFYEDGCAVAGCENAPPTDDDEPVARRGALAWGRPNPKEVETLARALWKIGNARIGERPWETVCAHYIAEAAAALEAIASADPHGRAPETLAHGQRCSHGDCPLEAACSFCGAVCLLHCVGRSTRWQALKYFLRAWRRYANHGRLV